MARRSPASPGRLARLAAERAQAALARDGAAAAALNDAFDGVRSVLRAINGTDPARAALLRAQAAATLLQLAARLPDAPTPEPPGYVAADGHDPEPADLVAVFMSALTRSRETPNGRR